jgi:hypothetical protein
MKFIVRSLFLFSFSFALANNAAHAAPLLDAIEEEDVLKSIDNICGDTWCEGDSNWSFDALACDSESGCVLDLTMKPYDFSEDQYLAPRAFTCNFPTLREKSILAEVTERGTQYAPALYTAVSDCISDLTHNYGPIYVPIDNRCQSLFGESTKNFTYFTANDVESHNIFGALEAVSQIVRKRAKKDSACQLQREPYYRDSATCSVLESGAEYCELPSIDGYYEVTRDPNGQAKIIYRFGPSPSEEGRERANAFKQKP